MRRLIFILACSTYCFLCAQEYQISEIENLAYSFFNKNQQYAPSIDGSFPTKHISSIEAISRDSTSYMYIVNAEDTAGWLIVSNEKTYPIIVAHGDSCSFRYNEEDLPPALIGILNCHMNMIDSVRTGRLQINAPEVLSQPYTTKRTTNSFLIDNKWKQSLNSDNLNADCEKSYNKFCPKILKDSCTNRPKTCNRKLVGCGAIAMAQIMKYWQWPDYAMVGNNVYYYDWDNMPYEINNNTEMYQVDKVTRLLENCRTAAKSFGICFLTGAFVTDVHNAMINVFGYHSNLVYESEDVYIPTMLMTEIDQGRPVLVQGWGDLSIHLEEIEAHYFVVDGYKIEGSDTTFHVNFGSGYPQYDKYYDLRFDQYYRWQKYLIELYPECSFRANNVSLNNTLIIDSLNNRTFYSANNVTICSNNNSITVDSGGHLLVKAGNEVRINSGFHAKPGSDVHIKVEDLCYNGSSTYSAPQYAPQRSSSAPSDDAETVNNIVTNDDIKSMMSKDILSTTVYSISGQLLQTIQGSQYDVSHLPNGMYILHHRMSDGSVNSEKIAHSR